MLKAAEGLTVTLTTIWLRYSKHIENGKNKEEIGFRQINLTA
jgi:hypothetical protein